ncbi:hypothetical protein KKG46_01515 [Patescibacteria group bacterium]|nr:hypothetical protein [Patescibacteria group bacterium]
MKKFKYPLIPFLNWIANYAIVILLVRYIFPLWFPSWISLAIVWIIAGILAMIFSYWAFHTKILSNRQLGWFIGVWVIIKILMEGIISFMGYTDPLFLVVRYEFFVNTIFEILGILLMYRVSKRHQAHQVLEGIEL